MKVTGVMHMHSTHSYDGKLSLKELKTFLQERGMQFACMTEHTDQLTKDSARAFMAECKELSDDSFVFIPGFEVPYKEAHVLHIGATDFVSSTTTEIELQQWRRAAPLVILAHPVRNRFNLDDTLQELIDGVEIWNQQYEGKQLPRPRSVKLLDELRLRRPRLFATGGLDFHRPEHFGSPLTTLDVQQFTEMGIMVSLLSGQFWFGNNDLQMAATETWQPTFKQKIQSLRSVMTIKAGKDTNKALHKAGLSAPTSLKKAIRSRV